MSENTPNSKHSILTQNLFLTVRKIKLRWFFVILLLPIFAIFAAFATTSTSDTQNLRVKTVVQTLRLPAPSAIENPDTRFSKLDLVRRNDTLKSLFERMAVNDDAALKSIMLNPEASAINRQLQPKHSMQINTDAQGKLLYLEYELNNESILTTRLTPDGLEVNEQKLPMQMHPVLKSATIRNSLFGATDDAGIPDPIAFQMAEIFSGEIDFNQDLRPGDKFNVIYEGFYSEGRLRKSGKVLAVEFVNKGKAYQAVHFGEAEGKYAYYTPEGKSLYASFLRSPLEFTRVSSSFSLGRFHPILQRMRSHQGVDLAAPTGTRIKASGKGVVEFIGKRGGYGNVIVLKHDSGISTVYGHLSGFTPSLKKGMAVAQSEIIGYVGMTGLATGPHLHYEFLLKGVHHNPMTVTLPTSVPIEGKFKKEFDSHSTNLMAQIAMLNRSKVATID